MKKAHSGRIFSTYLRSVKKKEQVILMHPSGLYPVHARSLLYVVTRSKHKTVKLS